MQTQQSINKNGRIRVSKKAWLFRCIAVMSFGVFASIVLNRALFLGDPWIILSISMPIHVLIVLISGWAGYRNPATIGNQIYQYPEPAVSVIVPIYNQKSLIEMVIHSIFKSTYSNFEVVAIDDGCTDGTAGILESLKGRYPKLKVIHKANGGKRRAVAAGFKEATGNLLVLIDSDSILDKDAISEFVHVFTRNPKIGALVGHVKVLNAGKNILTKCQDTWYDYAFNVQKSCESVYGSVTCCSGCLASYRREAIETFIPYWAEAKKQFADDRELTAFAISPGSGKKSLINRLLTHASKFDDSDDRVLTGVSMSGRWKSMYVASAVAYTEVPETKKQFFKQQLRWKKGTIRTNAFISLFFWRRHPIMAFLFYFEYIGTFLMPVLYTVTLIYEIVVVGEFWFPLFFLSLLLWEGIVVGVDYKLRDSGSKTWGYKIMMSFIQAFFLSMLVFPALWQIKKNQWGTR